MGDVLLKRTKKGTWKGKGLKKIHHLTTIWLCDSIIVWNHGRQLEDQLHDFVYVI